MNKDSYSKKLNKNRDSYSKKLNKNKNSYSKKISNNNNKLIIKNNNIYNNIKKKHQLQDKWIIWGHDINVDDWSIESYKKIYEFETIEDFWIFFNNIKLFKDFMLFVMRGNILPIYEDEMCKNGGFYSYVVPINKLGTSILLLLTRMIGETLTDKEVFDEIVGMSVSPKGSRAVIKIWNKNKNEKLNLYLKDIYFKDNYRYKSYNS